jgi:dolichol kinase
MADFLIAVAISLLFFASFAAIELIKRKFNVSPEIMRRFAHMSSGCVVLLEYIYLPQVWVLVLLIGGGTLFFIASRLNLLTSVNDVTRVTYGQYVLTLGYLGAYILSLTEPRVFIPSILIITFGDSLAGLTGTLLKATSRTFLGSVVFFTVTYLILWQFSQVFTGTGDYLFLLYFVIAGLLTIIERLTPLGFDNLTVPVAAALLLLSF